jgi:2-iminobutanoate/2-iminopropanoate deaminase
MRKLLLACAAVLLASPASAQSRAVIASAGGSGTLSNAIRVGDILYMSGQLPDTRSAGADTTIQGQTRSTLNRIKTIVDSAGAKMENVVKCTVFLINGADFQGMNQAYREFWPKEPPTRSTIVVAALVVPNAKLEIECMATYVK